MKGFYTVLLLLLSNTFMTLAWYGHLKFHEWKWFSKLGLMAVILLSWGIALFEYCFQVPANRIGYAGNGGPFTLVQLKVWSSPWWSSWHSRCSYSSRSSSGGITWPASSAWYWRFGACPGNEACVTDLKIGRAKARWGNCT